MQFEIVTDFDLTVYGSTIRERYNSDSLEEQFFKAREMISKGQDLVVVNYHELAEDTVHQLIGISGTETKAGWQKRSFRGDYIKTIIDAHNLVMPTPGQVRGQAVDYAKSQSKSINEDYTIELYEAENALVVYFPLKDR